MKQPEHYYVGLTTDLDARLEDHNAGKSIHTSKNRPWEVIVSLIFKNPQKAAAFEKYLKSGSGRAFCGRHF
jgi:predicted GIY-YIG superfamily endonuclease